MTVLNQRFLSPTDQKCGPTTHLWIYRGRDRENIMQELDI